MRYNLMFICFLFSFISFSQFKYPYTFGNIKQKELEMTRYDKDTSANAVVLYEHANSVVINNNQKIFIRTTVYKKIKIFNKDGEKNATVKIYIYNNKNKSREKVNDIKAITYNKGELNVNLLKDNIFTKTIDPNWEEVTFTFPNVKPGSVLEYHYNLESEFFFNFTGWVFQSDIPKIYSEFHALIPGNWKYNRSLKGMLRLATNKAEIKRNCFSVGSSFFADCEDLTYAMKDVPAFIEEEEYSTSKNNYISKIKFELAEITYTDGTSKKFTTSWKETDKRLKSDESIGRQLKYSTFFSKNLPNELLIIDDKLSQCKSIYMHMQNHFSLNDEKTYIFKDVDAKRAYKERLGSVSEINLALISALRAVDIDTKIILLSTKSKGFPTKVHPVMTDFNYLAAHITINNHTYLLDASDKYLSFDMLPFKALNSYGRVLDFKNESYWFSLSPEIKSFKRVSAKLTMNEEGLLVGNVKEINNGYFSKFKRELIKNEEDYLTYLENENENFEILSYNNKNLNKLENSLEENFEIEIKSAEFIGNKIYLNPFIEKYTKNPFQLNQRNYPINFGFKINTLYRIQIDIPNDYIIKTIPKNIAFKLPNNGGSFITNFKKENHKIFIYSKINLNQTIYKTSEYQYLKEFYNQIIKTQNSLITLEKISS